MSPMPPSRRCLALGLALALATGCGGESEPGVVTDIGPVDSGQPAVPPDTGAPDIQPADMGSETVELVDDEGSDSGVDPSLCPGDECEIEGECYANEAPNPENLCELCLVAVSAEEWTPNDAEPCDDGNACTATDHCHDGACVGSDATLCDDGNPCTDDACNPALGTCETSANTIPCDDGDACTLDSTCADGACGAGVIPLSCDDGKPCTLDVCDAKSGCSSSPVADGDPCEDGDECTVGDLCLGGGCAGSPRDCDDADVCTVDTCVPGEVCIHMSLADLCEDGNPCTDVVCDATAGCVYTFNVVGCDDDNACTGPDFCAGGACLGPTNDPTDDNFCTDDTCDPATGPVHLPNTNACDDDDLCTLGDICDGGVCAPGLDPLDCDDGDVCTDDLCDAGGGCFHELNALPCDDGSVCTQTDLCVVGECAGGAPLACDDGNECTIDACDAELGCTTTLVAISACRPEIVVKYPPRAATILGSSEAQVVVVTGTVSSGAGSVETLTINGKAAKITGDTFSLAMTPQVGGNTLVLVATDAMGSVRKRVQSYLWSTAYYKPELDKPKSGMVDPGMGIWLAKDVMQKLADSMGDIAGTLQLGESIPNPVFSGSGYKVYIKNLTHSTPQLSLGPAPGGMKLTVKITNIKADIDAPGKCKECVLGVCVDLCPDFDGDLEIGSITATASVLLSVVDHALVATVANVKVTVQGADVDIDGVIGFIIDPVLDNVVDDLIDDMESSIEGSMAEEIEPALEAALGALAFESTFDMPTLDPDGGSVTTQLLTDFSTVTFDASGGIVRLRTGAYAPKLTPHDNLGSLARVGCNVAPQTLAILKKNPFELTMSDDMVNELLHAAWLGGLLEFDAPAEMLADADLSDYGITGLTVSVSGMLAPTLSDCNEAEELEVHIGDLEVIADLTLLGTPMTVAMYITFTAGFEFKVLENELALGLTKIKSLDSDVTVLQDDLIGSEKLVADMVNNSLVPALMGSLDGGALGGIPLPAMDLGDGAVLTIVPKSVDRADGNTVVGGDLK